MQIKTDRTVHAWGESAEVVRYDKAGKWYLEPKGTMPRQAIGINDAAAWAIKLWHHDNGSVNFGMPGGMMFDRKVRAALGQEHD